MILLKEIIYYLYLQLVNLIKYFRGIPPTVASLGSNTLDLDDVIIARRALKDKYIMYNDKEIKKFEKTFSLWNGSKYVYSFSGGRVALSAILYALQLSKGDEVIIPGYTCIVIPNALDYAGIKIVFSDIELETYGIDASLIEEKITRNTKAILLHHLYGLVCRDYEKIIKIARQHNLYVIEDCAQSTGAKFKNVKVGNYGDAAFYSMEQSKIFTTFQGGLAVTNNEIIGKRLKEFQDNSISLPIGTIKKQLYSIIMNYYYYKDAKRWWKGGLYKIRYLRHRIITTTQQEENGEQPHNYQAKLSPPLAKIASNQMKKIDVYNTKRINTSKIWDKWCKQNNYKKPLIIPNSKPVFLRYPVLVDSEMKKDRSWAYKELGVMLGVWFSTNLHPSKRVVSNCPNANIAVDKCINFPCIID